MINYAEKIKEYREKKFLTQKEFADQIGVSVISVIRWENNQFNPTMKYKKLLCKLFEEAGIKTFD